MGKPIVKKEFRLLFLLGGDHVRKWWFDFCKGLVRYGTGHPSINWKEVKKRAENLLGSPYNASFYPDGDGYYCSQFIAELLPIFETIPMKFGEGEQEISSFWEDYYRELGLAVPLDQPGTNPSLLAQSPQLQFKERYLDDYNH